LLIFFTGYTIHAVLNPPKREYLYIAWLGNPAMFTQLNDLAQDLNVIIEDYERYHVVVTSYASQGNPNEDQAMQARFAGLMSMGNIDIILSTREGIEELIDVGWVRPMDDVLVYLPNMPDKRFFWRTPYGGRNPAIMAINLEGSSVMEAHWLMPEDLFLTLVVNASRPYEVSKALRVILDEL